MRPPGLSPQRSNERMNPPGRVDGRKLPHPFRDHSSVPWRLAIWLGSLVQWLFEPKLWLERRRLRRTMLEQRGRAPGHAGHDSRLHDDKED